MSARHDARARDAGCLLQSFVFDNERRAQVGTALGMSFSLARVLWRPDAGPRTMSELALLHIDAP